MIVAATNVVSEFMRERPDPRVLAWAESLGPSDLTVTVVTIEEIERGLRRLPAGRRRRDLQLRWNALSDAYADTVLVYDASAARATAQVLVAAQASGHSLGLADAQIAGICLSNGCQLATRNVKDFIAITGLVVLEPFA